MNRYLHNTNYIGNVLDSIWNGQSDVRDYQLIPFNSFNQNILTLVVKQNNKHIQIEGKNKKTKKDVKKNKRKKENTSSKSNLN